MSLDALETALVQRLRAVAPFLLDPADHEVASSSTVGPLLDLLARRVQEGERDADVWLLCVAVAGAYPTRAEFLIARRGLMLARTDERIPALLSAMAMSAAEGIAEPVEIEVVDAGIVVDVDFCARHEHNTGIQRVVRQTMPHWLVRGTLSLAAWAGSAAGYRRLSASEHRRVVEWGRRADRPEPADPAPRALLVPRRSTVILPEVGAREVIDRLSTLAEYSGNEVTAIGYDAIPIVSAAWTTTEESERFARYLSVVKHAARVAAISDSARSEFTGFCSTLASQGLPGPAVSAVVLPVEFPTPAGDRVASSAADGPPTVLMVGSLEPRKNQTAVLHAAELLWRRGVSFRLEIIGGGSAWYLARFLGTVRALASAGRDVVVRRGVDDAELRAAYERAAFVIFPSLHEGFGLPVAEALAAGKPVITSDFGSTAEIASTGGCLLVDPRDDLDIAAAMESLLTDPDELRRLTAEIEVRAQRTWADYASELWDELVTGTLGAA